MRSFLISDRLTAPIVGSLAGNVLSHFRVELDYPDQKQLRTDSPGKNRMDCRNP